MSGLGLLNGGRSLLQVWKFLSPAVNIIKSGPKAWSYAAGQRFSSTSAAPLSCQSVNETTMQVSLPGWSFDDLDRHGMLRLWRALYTVDFVREYAFDEGFLDMRDVERTHMTYVKCLDIETQPHVTKPDEALRFAFSYPFTIDLSLSHIGRTSICLDHQVRDMSSNLMMTSALTYVFVDNISNQTSHAPKWWAQKYQPLLENTTPFKLQIPDFTMASHKYKVVVAPTDIDYYGHVNNTAYHKFCTDAGMAAANKGLLGNIVPNVIDTKAKKIESEYTSDCLLGQELTVQVSTDNMEEVHFLITRGNDEPVYKQMLYY